MVRLFQNLISNAVQYRTEATPDVHITAEQVGADWLIRVRDNGVGIPPEMREKVFELFVQLGKEPSNASTGMGVGLTLVQALVRLHGGEISVDGNPGKGSEFTVRLPAVEKEKLPPPPASKPVPLQGLRVLLVEDIPDIRAMTQRLLKMIGCEVEVAEDGPSGVQKVAEVKPQVALVDIGLPGLDGYEVAQKIRSRSDLDGVKLIAVTGFGQEEDRRKAIQAGFDAHLVKPVDLTELQRLLCKLGGRPC